MPHTNDIPAEHDPRIGALFDMQADLHRAHPEWGGLPPEQAPKQLLWLVGELGEVIDVIKKAPVDSYMNAGPNRAHLVEEMVDVLMYYIDAAHCMGITADELADAYRKKHEYNMVRDYSAQNKKKYGGSN